MDPTLNNWDTGSLFELSPNPTKGRIRISSVERIEELVVTNVSGQTILRMQPQTSALELDLTNVQTGLYFVKVKAKSGEWVKKVMIR